MSDKRFRFESTESKSTISASWTQIIVDTNTGVQYLYMQSGYGGGLTVLVDKDGKPLLAPEYQGL